MVPVRSIYLFIAILGATAALSGSQQPNVQARVDALRENPIGEWNAYFVGSPVTFANQQKPADRRDLTMVIARVGDAFVGTVRSVEDEAIAAVGDEMLRFKPTGRAEFAGQLKVFRLGSKVNSTVTLLRWQPAKEIEDHVVLRTLPADATATVHSLYPKSAERDIAQFARWTSTTLTFEVRERDPGVKPNCSDGAEVWLSASYDYAFYALYKSSIGEDLIDPTTGSFVLQRCVN